MASSASNPVLTPSLSSTLIFSDIVTSYPATTSASQSVVSDVPLPVGSEASALPEIRMSMNAASSVPARPTKKKATSTHVISTSQPSHAATLTPAASLSTASSSSQEMHSTSPLASPSPPSSESSTDRFLQSSSLKPVNQPNSPSSTPSSPLSAPSNTLAPSATAHTAAHNSSVPAKASTSVIVHDTANKTSTTPIVSHDTHTGTNLSLAPGPTPVIDSNYSTIVFPPQGIVSSSPASTVVPKLHSKHGFFSDHSAVAGVFVTVTLVILAFLALLPWVLAHCRRRRREKYAAMEPSMTMVDGPPYPDNVHHRRASQRQAFSDILSAGASANRPLSGRNTGFPGSRSNESCAGGAVYSSRAIPSASRQDSEGLTNGYPNIVYYPGTTSANLPPALPEIPKQNIDLYPDLIDAPRFTNSLYPTAVNSVLRSGTYPNNLNTNSMADVRASTSTVRDSMAYAQDSMANSATNSNETSSLPGYPAIIRSRPPPPPPPSDRPVIPARSPYRMLGITHPPKAAVQPASRNFYAQSNPLVNNSQHSVAQSSPSVYEPTLPDIGHTGSEDEDEEEYWRRQGFEKVLKSDSSGQSNNVKNRTMSSSQEHAPLQSVLGLSLSTHSNHSESTIKQYSSVDQESELIRHLDSRAEPPWIHQVSTAPIAMPPPLLVRDGRYPSLTARSTFS